MLRMLARYRDVVLVALCLLAPAIILYAQSRPEAEAGPLMRALLTLTAPVKDGVSAVVVGVSDAWTRHWQDAESLEDARRLRIETAGLRRQAERLDEFERENQRLRDLLAAAPTPGPARFTAARVIAVGASPVWRTVRLDAGRSSGVTRGMAVVSAEGAVGTVLRTSHGYSDVLLLSDRQSAVDVVLPRTGARGLLRGTGAEGGSSTRVEGVERDLGVREGDDVVTSGLGARFPRGTRVGVVTGVEAPEGSLTLSAEVRPLAPFDRLRDVLLVLAPEAPRGAATIGPALPTGGLHPPRTDAVPVVPAGEPAVAPAQPRAAPAPAPAPAPAGPEAPPPDTPVPQESVTPGVTP